VTPGRGSEGKSEPESCRVGVAVSECRAQHHTHDVPQVKFDGVSIRAAHGVGRFESVVPLVDPRVDGLYMQQSMSGVEPHVDDIDVHYGVHRRPCKRELVGCGGRGGAAAQQA